MSASHSATHPTRSIRCDEVLVGTILVNGVLLIFWDRVPSELIVVTISLVLLFAFSLMYFRGRSAKLLS